LFLFFDRAFAASSDPAWSFEGGVSGWVLFDKCFAIPRSAPSFCSFHLFPKAAGVVVSFPIQPTLLLSSREALFFSAWALRTPHPLIGDLLPYRA